MIPLVHGKSHLFKMYLYDANALGHGRILGRLTKKGVIDHGPLHENVFLPLKIM